MSNQERRFFKTIHHYKYGIDNFLFVLQNSGSSSNWLEDNMGREGKMKKTL
jgi:hypothetical protein